MSCLAIDQLLQMSKKRKADPKLLVVGMVPAEPGRTNGHKANAIENPNSCEIAFDLSNLSFGILRGLEAWLHLINVHCTHVAEAGISIRTARNRPR